MSRRKTGSDAWAISDRSGMRFRMREMIKEPGTGYLIHRSESDGKYNQVDHPQANLWRYADLSGDPAPIENARPDIDHVLDIHLLDSNGNFILDSSNLPIEALLED
jgi:hypothetical protein